MPHFDIIKKVNPKKSFRVDYVKGTYDLNEENMFERFSGKFELPEKWNIGLIVGHSGSGKSTIAKELFGKFIVNGFDYTHDNILDDMPKECSMSDICNAFISVGFSSPPSWLKPYHVLSNGEKMRVDLARAILENKDMFVFDEYTSVVDRNVAKIGSYALQKVVRKKNKRFVAVTCHYDVEEYLMPDWVFCTDDMTFREIDPETQKKNRPKFELRFYETKWKSRFWNVFRKYHYLNHDFNASAHVFLCTCNGELCGFCAVLPFPHGVLKNMVREHRTVVLPDYQGVGIGTCFTDYVAGIYKQNGKTLISTTSNPAMIYSRSKNKKWIAVREGRTGLGGITSKIQNKNKKGTTSNNRITVGFRYVG